MFSDVGREPRATNVGERRLGGSGRSASPSRIRTWSKMESSSAVCRVARRGALAQVRRMSRAWTGPISLSCRNDNTVPFRSKHRGLLTPWAQDMPRSTHSRMKAAAVRPPTARA